MGRAPVSPPPGAELEVFADRQTRQDLASLRDLHEPLPDDPVGGRRREIELAESRHARVRAQHARQRIENGRLAGSVGSDEGDDLSLADAERDPAHRLDRAVGDLQIANVEEGRGRLGSD